jgi:hypothetical protein
MSANRLDTVDTFDQFGHDHWKALGTKLGGVEVVKAILRGTSAVTVDIIRRLTSLTSLAVAGNSVNSHDFFKTREGLWVTINFNDLILSGASKKKVSADETTVSYADLAQAANDAEIGAELPEGYVFGDVDTFLVHLATLIEGQWGGKSGVLLNNGDANIFYVKVNGEVFAVGVYWYADHQKWYCYVLRLGSILWLPGGRAFSATAA